MQLSNGAGASVWQVLRGWRSQRRVQLLVLMSLAALVLGAARSAQVTGDTDSYMLHMHKRTPGYPLFLDLARLVSTGDGMKAAQVLQTAAGTVAALCLSLFLGAGLGATRWLYLVHALLLFPVVRLGKIIGPESLCYALFLLFVVALAQAARRPSVAAVARMLAAMVALVLTRPQFLFLYPVVLLFLVWLAFAFRRRWSQRAAWAGLLAAALLIPPVAQRTYNYVFSGKAQDHSFAGLQLLTVAAYIADDDVVGRIPDPRAAAFFGDLLQRLDARKMRAVQAVPPQTVIRHEHFNRHYNAIILEMLPAFQRQYGLDRMTVADWVTFDRVTVGLALRVFAHKPQRLLAHIGKELQEEAGLFPVIITLLGALGAYGYWRSRQVELLLPFWVGLLAWSNYLLIALVEPIATRYSFYTEALVPPVLVWFILTTWYGARSDRPAIP